MNQMNQLDELNLKYVKQIVWKYAKLGCTIDQNYRYIVRNHFITKDQRKLLRNELRILEEII